MIRKVLFYVLLIVFITTLILLVSGSSILSKSIAGEFVFGSLITWLGLIALPSIIFLGFSRLLHPENKKDKIYSLIIKGLIFLSSIWGFVSYALAGNWSFNFNEAKTTFGEIENSTIFWNNTYGLVLLPLLFLIIFLLFNRKQN